MYKHPARDAYRSSITFFAGTTFFDALSPNLFYTLFDFFDYSAFSSIKLVDRSLYHKISTTLMYPESYFKMLIRLPMSKSCTLARWYQTTPIWQSLRKKQHKNELTHIEMLSFFSTIVVAPTPFLRHKTLKNAVIKYGSRLPKSLQKSLEIIIAKFECNHQKLSHLLKNTDEIWAHTNLAGINLSYEVLKFANLARANLAFTDFTCANLENANLRQAYLYNANLCYAFLPSADLSQAYMRRANLTAACFTNARLNEVNLIHATMQGTQVNHARLEKARMLDITTDAEVSLNRLKIEGLQKCLLYRPVAEDIVCQLQDTAAPIKDKIHFLDKAVQHPDLQPDSFFKNWLGRLSIFSQTHTTSTPGKTTLLKYKRQLEELQLEQTTLTSPENQNKHPQKVHSAR